ncbi:uncharacterized protein LOC135483896 [Lineus longissimus]|uniref:uncharacterized protein LOC135483896 n=1 Tax=Lineus longissimus TaxID=88925 RepID=UPI002B4DE46A
MTEMSAEVPSNFVFDEECEKVYNVGGAELVVKVPGKMQGRGARKSKGLAKPRPLQQTLAQLNRNKFSLEQVRYVPDMEKRGEDGTDEARFVSGLSGIVMKLPVKQVIDENNNLGHPLDLDDIGEEIEKQSYRLKTVEISAEDMDGSSNSDDYEDASEYFTPQVAETEHEVVQTPQVAETETKLVQNRTPQGAKTEPEPVQAQKSATNDVQDTELVQVKTFDTDHVRAANRRVFPMRQLSVINDTMNRVRTPSGTDHAVVDSKVKGNSEVCSRVDTVVEGELEHMEQIIYNLQSYQFLHPEVICMCDSLKKTGHKITSYFPARTSRLYTELKRVVKGQVRGVHPAIPKHLIACGVVTLEKEQTIGQLSAVSSKALSEAFTDVVANEEVEQDSEPTAALLAAVSSKALNSALTSAVIESNRRPPIPQGRETYGTSQLGANPGSVRSTKTEALQRKSVSFDSPSAQQPDHTIGVNALRTPGDRKGMPYNPPVTFTLEQKLKTVSSWPPSMLEGFLNDSTDPVDAVKRLATSLETDCRFVVKTLRCDTRSETHTCTCSVAGRSFPVGYGFTAEGAKVEAALNVLTNTIGGPRDRFIKMEGDKQPIKKEHVSVVVRHQSDNDIKPTGAWQPSLPPPPNRIASPTKSVCSPESTPTKLPPARPDSLSKKLRLVVRYPTPTLQTYLDDLSDPITSVFQLSYCLEMKPKFMNDLITANSQGESHTSICCIGNLAFTPGYGADVQTAKNEAALNAMNEILSMAKEHAK